MTSHQEIIRDLIGECIDSICYTSSPFFKYRKMIRENSSCECDNSNAVSANSWENKEQDDNIENEWLKKKSSPRSNDNIIHVTSTSSRQIKEHGNCIDDASCEENSWKNKESQDCVEDEWYEKNSTSSWKNKERNNYKEDEWCEENSQKSKERDNYVEDEWYEENSQKSKERYKYVEDEWYEENSQKSKERCKYVEDEWYEENSQKSKERYKYVADEWYEENSLKNKEHNNNCEEDDENSSHKPNETSHPTNTASNLDEESGARCYLDENVLQEPEEPTSTNLWQNKDHYNNSDEWYNKNSSDEHSDEIGSAVFSACESSDISHTTHNQTDSDELNTVQNRVRDLKKRKRCHFLKESCNDEHSSSKHNHSPNSYYSPASPNTLISTDPSDSDDVLQDKIQDFKKVKKRHHSPNKPCNSEEHSSNKHNNSTNPYSCHDYSVDPVQDNPTTSQYNNYFNPYFPCNYYNSVNTNQNVPMMAQYNNNPWYYSTNPNLTSICEASTSMNPETLVTQEMHPQNEQSPPIVEFSEKEAKTIVKQLRDKKIKFKDFCQVVITWLKRGSCNWQNSHTFFSLIQSLESNVSRLESKLSRAEVKIQNVKERLTKKSIAIAELFDDAEKVLQCASIQKARDCFTKAQKEKFDFWREKINLLTNSIMVQSRIEADMEISDEECSEKEEISKIRNQLQVCEKRLVAFEHVNRMMQLNYLETKKKLEESLGNQKNRFSDNFTQTDSEGLLTSRDENISNVEARLIALISTFLSVHPLGASLDYICSYLGTMQSNINSRDIEDFMKKFTSIFKEESTGIGTTLVKKWKYLKF